MRSPTDLFGSADQPPTVDAYDRWRASLHGRFNDTTSAVQRSMWNSFASWCQQQGIAAVTVTANELHAFVHSREGSAAALELTPRYAWRLLRLINLVVNHMATEEDAPRNMAASELLRSRRSLRLANDEAADPLPETLTDSEDRALVSFLESSVPRAGRDAGLRWQDIRNRAAVALQRGAGLAPLEIRTLRVRDLHLDPDPKRGAWKVRAPATGSIQAHDAPVARWARPLLIYWSGLRSQLAIPGDWLFPSTRTGKQLGKTAHFDGSAQVLSSAGLTGSSAAGGGYKLRHTFALRQLAKRPSSSAELAAWLGIKESEISRYRRVLSHPVDVD